MKKIFSSLSLVFILLISLIVSPSAVFATQASVKCLPSSGTYKVGDTFPVDINLDTRSFPVYGADIVATYGSTVIEAQSAQFTALLGTTNWTAPGTNTVGSGQMRLDYGKAQPAYTGSTSIGQITFKAKAPGQANFNISFFQPYDDTSAAGTVAKVWGKKDGTNITNILTDVNNCIFVVEGAPTSPPSTPAPTITALPNTGTFETTVTFLALAGVFILVGTIIPAWDRKRE